MHLKQVSFKTRRITSELTVGWMVGFADVEQLQTPGAVELPPSSVFCGYSDAAAAGNSEAVYAVGRTYELGVVFLMNSSSGEIVSVLHDANTARCLFLLAEAQGNPEAAFRLGLMEHHGVTNQTVAGEHFRKGAIAGSGDCCRMLGIYCVQSKDWQGATAWFIQGAKLGDPASCVNAATLISQSKFVEHPADEALAYALCAERAMPEDQDIQDLISTIRDSQSGKAR